MRDVKEIMDINRLGVMFASRLSFSRSLLRKMYHNHWRIRNILWDLDLNGYGNVIYEIKTKKNLYHFVLFANYIPDDERNDRVIANQWDTTFSLVEGEVDSKMFDVLKANVPLQEAGRNMNKALVLARANKSVRIFDYILESLSNGIEPSLEEIAKVGYILRTTAVYGSGKFGNKDFDNLSDNEDFSQSFIAEMLVVYLVRQFSIEWMNFLAKNKGGSKAIALNRTTARYLGVGNATGLGMAPYLIKHAKVVDNWLYQRELALEEVMEHNVDANTFKKLLEYVARAQRHLLEIVTIDAMQDKLNKDSSHELESLLNDIKLLGAHKKAKEYIEDSKAYSLQTQEALISIMLELYPSVVDKYDDCMRADESSLELSHVSLGEVMDIIESRYDFAINTDFAKDENNFYFWYISEEKEEPRLGQRGVDKGSEKELPLDIARQVKRLYACLQTHNKDELLSSFLLQNPRFSSIARRVWTMGHCALGEIRANVLHKDFLPIHLLRAKLALFGASKFDPRSLRWVQVNLFQGAPLIDEIHPDEWIFPLLPSRGICVEEDTIIISQNELKAACIKAYHGLKLAIGEPELVAHMVLDMQMAGLNGVEHFLKALPYLKNDNAALQIDLHNGVMRIDLQDNSIVFHIQIIIAHALEILKEREVLRIEMKACHNRAFIYPQLKRLAKKNLHAKAFWYSQNTQMCYCIHPLDEFISIFKTPSREHKKYSLEMLISHNGFEQQGTRLKSPQELKEAYDNAYKNGIVLQKMQWEQLKEAAKAILVESSEQSRNEAGGMQGG